jgi:hypothetical protein
MPKTSTEKPRLSTNGQKKVLDKMITLGIGKKNSDLCRSINKYFFQQAFPDISVDREIKLEPLEKESLESLLGVSLEEKDFKFTEPRYNPKKGERTINELLGAYLYKNGFSPDVVRNFYKMIPIEPKPFKSLCKFLGLTYNEVVEDTKNVNLQISKFSIRDALVSKFNHTEEKEDLNDRLVSYDQRLPVLYKGTEILSLKWYLLRCLSNDCLTCANEIFLSITFSKSKSQKTQTTNGGLIDTLFEKLLQDIKGTSIPINSEIDSIKELKEFIKKISIKRMNDDIKETCRKSGFLRYAKIDAAVKSITDKSLPAKAIENINQAIRETIHSIIAEALVKVLSKQNVVFIFELEEYGQEIFSVKSLFWDKLVEYLSERPATDYGLLFLVKANSDLLDYPIYNNNFQDFEKISPKQCFLFKNLRDWLSDEQVQKVLKLEDQTAIKEKLEKIWQDANKEGQPEALLKAIYKNFTNKETETWEEVSDKWINL